MFTGIVEEKGKIISIEKNQQGSRLCIAAEKILEDIHLGDSISTNGICLTVTNFDSHSFSVDVMPETIKSSSFNSMKTGDEVNLERAMQMNNRFGGHIVSGHIDGVGEIIGIAREGNAFKLDIKIEKNLMKYLMHKGSVTVDGVSLTVQEVGASSFKVGIIPHTGQETILLDKKKGGRVNIECDVLAKYVERLLGYAPQNDIDKDFLGKHGFI